MNELVICQRGICSSIPERPYEVMQLFHLKIQKNVFVFITKTCKPNKLEIQTMQAQYNV